ncbi:Lysosomal thioesterase PPT2-A [Bulinus truncatus]|nr:Lysosomal thioesterase PPT2-A [Bulinus truncatus]
MNYSILLITCFITITTKLAWAYKNVVIMHGFMSYPQVFDYFKTLINEYHPNTPVTVIDMYDRLSSVTDIWTQVEHIGESVKPILTNTSSEGTVLICYSQGGLICRGLLATLDHNVQTFISLSSPLSGQYGMSKWMNNYFARFTTHNIFWLFYTFIGQKFSVAQYWNDPHHQTLYRRYSSFLAVLNNQSEIMDPRSHEFRDKFLKIHNLVLIGGPDDEVITPWQSSQFGTYDDSESVLSMKDQEWFINDAFGLKTLQMKGNIHTYTIPGVRHSEWREKKQVFDTCIKPWL